MSKPQPEMPQSDASQAGTSLASAPQVGTPQVSAPQVGAGPFSAFERMIAMRYLRPRRKEGFVSAIAGFSFVGIALGVAALIIVMAVMNGFRTELLKQVLGFNGHAMVLPIASGQPIADFRHRVKLLKQQPDVVKAIPFVEGQILVSSNRTNTGALVRGMSEANLKTLKGINNKSLRGTLDGFDKAQGVVIGYKMAWQHGVTIGNKITLVSPEGPATIFGSVPRIRGYRVVAIFDAGMSEYDKNVVFMGFEEAQEYFVSEDGATAIEVMVKNPDAIDEIIGSLKAAAGPGIQFISWKASNASLRNALVVERNVMFLILTLIILIATLNIISGLIMLVKGKGPDIAILRTMGASKGAIQRIFFMTGAIIGVLGTVVGVILGIIVCLNIESIRYGLEKLSGMKLFPQEVYFLSQLPAELNVSETVFVAVMAISFSFIATLYPSWQAAKLDPVEALRYG